MGVTVSMVTCGPQMEVALLMGPGNVPSVVRLAGISPRSTLLVAALDLLVEDAGENPSGIERIVVSRGPGSFTGIRAGLATAAGLAEANGATRVAYDSLLAQAARCAAGEVVWAAQPGRRGEVYARQHRMIGEGPPEPIGDIEILPVGDLAPRTPWIAPESLDLGIAVRVSAARSSAEALLALDLWGVPSQPVEPLYVEGPPIQGSGTTRG